MAEEATGSDSSSDDSLSEDESSYSLFFDLPDNDQTWLYCSPGDDPNRVVDLGELLRIKPSCLTKTLQISEETGGHVIDTRTFTRPKKQSVLGSGKNIPQTQKHTDVNVDVSIKKTEVTATTKIPFMTAAVKESGPISSLKSEYAKLQQNKENLILPPYVKKNVQRLLPNITSHSPNISFNDSRKSKTRPSDEITLIENISQPQSFMNDYTLSYTSSDPDNSSQLESNPQISPLEAVISDLNATYNKARDEDKSKELTVFKQPLVSTPKSKDVGISFKPTLVSTPIKSDRITPSENVDKQDKQNKADYVKSGNFNTNLENITLDLDDTFIAPNINKSRIISNQTLVIKGSNENILKIDDETSKTLEPNKETSRLVDTTFLLHCEDRDYSIIHKKTNIFDKSTIDTIIKGRHENELDTTFLLQSPKISLAKWTNKGVKPKNTISQRNEDSSYNLPKEDLDALKMPQIEGQISIKYKTIRKSVSHDSLLSQPVSLQKTEKKMPESLTTLTPHSGVLSDERFTSMKSLIPTFISTPASHPINKEGRYGSLKSLTGLCKSTQTLLPINKEEKYGSLKSLVPASISTPASHPINKGGSLLKKPIYSVKHLQNPSFSKNKPDNLQEAEKQSTIVPKDTKASGIKPPTATSRIPRGRGVTKIPKLNFRSKQN